MKKLLTLIAVFAFTAPVLAADGDPNVKITCEAEGTTVTVSYALQAQDGFDPASDPMRGIAFNITTSNTAKIATITDYAALNFAPPVNSEGIDDVSGYIIHMGSIVIGPQDPNFVTNFGDPVAPNTDPGALGGLGTTGITVEMGSLYSANGTPPGSSGMLFKITIDLNGESSTDLTIVGESTRGGPQGECVLESGQMANVLSTGCTVSGVCYIVGQPRYYDQNMNPGPAITQDQWNTWDSLGQPKCWCCPHHGLGDTNGDGYVNSNDVSAINNVFMSGVGTTPPLPASSIRLDVNHDGYVNSNDVSIANNNFMAGLGQLPNTCPDCP